MFYTIDLHGCTKQEAKVQLDRCLLNLPAGQHEITVIHGYSTKVLLDLVQKQYHHKRLLRKILTLNKGETVFIIQ